MRFRLIYLTLIALLLFQSHSCENRFPENKVTLNEDQLWWNGLNDTWQELCLRESGHLGQKISKEILADIMLLEKFEADYYPIGEEGLNPLKHLTHLKEVSAGSTQLTSLDPLKDFKDLRYLNIPATPIEDLSPLSKMLHIEELYIMQTQVSDLSPLSQAEKLQVLLMHQSQVSSLQPIMHLQNLSIISIGSCPIPKEEIDAFAQLHPNCEINQ